MSDSPVSQSASGSNNVQVAGDHNTTIVAIYGQPVQATKISAAELAAAQARLAQLPLDHVPPIAPLPDGSRIVYRANSLFVGREVDLKHLAQGLHVDREIATSTTVAVTGLGGVGKTQTAVEFIHRYGTFFMGGVFWLGFENPDNIPTEIAQCGFAMNLRLDFSALTLEDQVREVRSAWESALPRLLIFDNCEDEALLRAFRPVSDACHVLITSRRADWDGGLDVQTIALDVLSLDDSVKLLRKLNSQLTGTDTAMLQQLSEEVGRLPLALHLVGSYFHTYRRVMSPAQVLEELRNGNTLAQKALTGEFGVSLTVLPTKHDINVSRTFQLSFSKLDPTNVIDALAIRLLVSAACLAPGEPIPHRLLTKLVLSEEASTNDTQRAEDGLTRLTNLGLLETASIEPPTFRLHRLLVHFVQIACQSARTSIQGQIEQVMLAEAYRLNEDGLVKPLAEWIPHLRQVTDTAVAANSQVAISLIHNLGTHLSKVADYAGARIRFEQALRIAEAAFGPNNPHVATHANNLGMVLRNLGDYAGAKSRLEQALRIDETAFGPDHSSMAANASNLGNVLQNLGDYTGAKIRYEQALRIDEATFGPDHPDVARDANNLGSVLQALGDYAGAKTRFEQALRIHKAAFGPDHPSIATNFNNLGMLLRDLGDYPGAKTYFEQALRITEAALGPDHPSVATNINNLGIVLWDLGDFAGAKTCFEQTLRITEAAFGPDHPSVATVANNLGMVLQNLGGYAEAKIRFEQALTIHEAAFGPDHPSVATVANNLGMVLQNLGDYASAKTRYEQALKIHETIFGPDHPSVATVANNLGSMLQDLGDFAGAKTRFEQALKIHEAAFGPDHPDVATNASNLGMVLRDLGDFASAKTRFEQTLRIREAAFGPDHPDVATAANSLGMVLRDLGDFASAKTRFEQTLRIHEVALGPDHLEVGIDVTNLGLVLWVLGDYASAKTCFEQALRITEAALGPNNPSTITIRNNFARLLSNPL